jgi:hypothetical protein
MQFTLLAALAEYFLFGFRESVFIFGVQTTGGITNDVQEKIDHDFLRLAEAACHCERILLLRGGCRRA